MTLTDRIDEFLAVHKSEIIHDLKHLIQIPSVKEAAAPGAPNGAPCAMALNASAKLFQRMGLKTKIFDNSGYALAKFGQGDKTIGLFSHCDVVPAGGGWIYTEPFVPIEKSGFIVGRGAEDNKIWRGCLGLCGESNSGAGVFFKQQACSVCGVR